MKLNQNLQLIPFAVQIRLLLQSWIRPSSESMYTCIPETSDKALFLCNPFWVYKMSGFIAVSVLQMVPVSSKNMYFALSKGKIYREGRALRHLILSGDYSL